MITEEEYLAAKKIVDQYEIEEWTERHRQADNELEEIMFDDSLYDDEEDDTLDILATDCVCGAYKMTSRGWTLISDCCC